METWLTILEMETNNSYQQNHSLLEASFDEELAATLGEDFPYPFCPSKKNTENSPTSQCDFDHHFLYQPILPSLDSNREDTINQNEYNNTINTHNNNNNNNTTQDKKNNTSGSTKRKRHPSQVQDHIIAERKRRELLGQLFISLSSIVPGLKKTDKTSVLGEAIKHMKQLKEKVKTLEEVVEKRTIESMVVVKKSQLIIDNDNGEENNSSCTIDGVYAQENGDNNNNGGKDYDADFTNYLLPEVEVKISGNSLLLRVYCENGKGVISKIFEEIDKYDMSISSCNVIPFESLALDITIVAQMESCFIANVEDFVKTLRSSLPSAKNNHHYPASS